MPQTDIFDALALSGEPAIPNIADLVNPNLPKVTVNEAWELQLQKWNYQIDYLNNIREFEAKAGRELDAIIAPITPTAAIRHNQFKYYGYATAINVLDFTSLVVPVTFADKNVDVFPVDFKPLTKIDSIVQAEYDPDIYHGAPVAVQIIGRRLTEERIMAIAEEVDTFFQYVEFLDKKESQAFSQLAKHDYPTFNAIRASIISPEGEMASALRGLADDIEDLRAMALDAWHWLPLQGLVDFCSRQWFGRMWVVQEACLPKRLVFVCGNKTCDASLLERALLFTFLAVALKAATWNEDDVGRHYPTMDDMTYALALVRFANRLFGVRRTIHRESDSRFSVLSLLAKFNVADTVNASTAARDLQKFRAGDARDCYFSILALPRQDDPVLKTVRVDYASSAQLVFRDLAGSLVEAGQTDLILFSQNHVKRLDGLPSWVPDWTSELTKPHGYMNSETPLFCAGMAQGSGAIWGGYTDTHVEGGALFIPGLDAGAVEMVGTNYYEISASETETAQSLDLFLSDTTAFSSLATQNNKHLTAGYSQEDLAALLASGGRGILPRPSPGPSQHVGATMQGRTIAGATYQVLRRRTARHVRAIRRMVLSKLQATTSQESGNGPYMPEAHQSLELSLEGAIRGDGCEAREDGEGSAEETESTQMLRSEADVDDEEGIGPDLQVEVRLAEGVYGLAVDGPEDMRRGDRLVILKGASVPMVLRRLTLGGGEMWGYVGEAYCYGFIISFLTTGAGIQRLKLINVRMRWRFA
ncbi:unnamed protein product [Parascedosporium putredinis]|uniref:Amidase domain-containing protein n=1 Tax=Parascedosporium putredinis TaxID=1442378 RepID=A0A9P1H7W4_9PEZI|nr:unnamed protein product [Parascedosporium putredinis]CAI8000255.1 unnamed protein product [Parascedosporium putredinis]